MGFFAGITIEADHGTVDLNQHELKMGLEFYFKQRWFALIELSNQQFLPGQGAAFFGPEVINVQDITIKHGILGTAKIKREMRMDENDKNVMKMAK